MPYPKLIGGIALAALAILMSGAQAFAEATYTDLTGQWRRRVVPGLGGQPSHDQTKFWGFGQQAPLTPEYTKVLEASLADQALGGQGNLTYGCNSLGMPLMMIAFTPLEFVITPETTHILI